MTKTTLVPLDGSRLAERALPPALALARAARARVVLVRVLPPPRPDFEGEPDSHAEEYVHDLARSLMGDGLEIEPLVYRKYYEPTAQAILNAAHQVRADLIALSTHGRGGVGRWLYGSVADETLRHASIPVLIISPACDQTWPDDRAPRVLVPIDGSPASLEALRVAADLGGQIGAELHLLQVTEPISTTYVEGFYIPEALDPDAEMEAGRRYLDQVAGAHRAAGLAVQVHAAYGRVPSRIASVAGANGIDLIVMATHGRGGVARLVLGSVATATLQQASVPLLLIRPSGAGPTGSTARVREAVPLLLSGADLTVLARGLGELLGPAANGQALAEGEVATARDLLARIEKAKSGLATPVAGTPA